MSPDLGDMSRQGCPKSPEWEGELELGSTDEDEEDDNASSADEKKTRSGGQSQTSDRHCGFWIVNSFL